MTGIIMTRKTKFMPTITLTNMTLTLTIEHDYKHLHQYDQGDHHHLHQDDLADSSAVFFNGFVLDHLQTRTSRWSQVKSGPRPEGHKSNRPPHLVMMFCWSTLSDDDNNDIWYDHHHCHLVDKNIALMTVKRDMGIECHNFQHRIVYHKHHLK